MTAWPESPAALIAEQRRIAAVSPPPWEREPGPLRIGGCFVCFARHRSGPLGTGEPAWAAAAVTRGHRLLGQATVRGLAGAPYEPGLLALREGPLLDAAVRALPHAPHVLIVNATGRDHPRRCGLATHLGAVLGIATIGVTHRPLHAHGESPGDQRGATAPLLLDAEIVGFRVRTRPGANPVAVTAGWRTDPATAVTLALAAVRRARTPEPLRRARAAARRERAGQ